jgi:hypothetical protein
MNCFLLLFFRDVICRVGANIEEIGSPCIYKERFRLPYFTYLAGQCGVNNYSLVEFWKNLKWLIENDCQYIIKYE